MENYYMNIPPLEDFNDIQYENRTENFNYKMQINEAFENESNQFAEYANSVINLMPENERSAATEIFPALLPIIGKVGAALIPKATSFIAKAAPTIAKSLGSTVKNLFNNFANKPYQNIQQGAQYAQNYGQQLPQQFNNLMNQPLQNVIPPNLLNQQIGNIIPQSIQDIAGKALTNLSSLLNNDTIRTLINNLANPQPGVLNYSSPTGANAVNGKEAFDLINTLSSYAAGNIPFTAEGIQYANEAITRSECILDQLNNKLRY